MAELTRSAVVSAWRKCALCQAVLFAVILCLALAGLAATPFWRGIELKGFDLLSVLSAPKKSTLPIVLVGIDDASLAEMQQRWPWPRGLHGQLIGALKEAGAAVIAFDVVFDYSSEKKEDDALAEAIKKSGNVILAAGMVKQETDHGTVWLRKDPLSLLKENGAVAGLVNLEFDRDQVMRRIPDNQDAFWRKIVAKLQATLPDARFYISLKPDAMIRYIGPMGTYPRISFYQALNPARYLSKGELADSLVIVGRDTRSAANIGSAQVDTFSTPYTSFSGDLMPGMEIHANILENVLAGQSVNPAPEWAGNSLLGVTMLLAALAMRRFRPIMSALLGMLLMAIVAALAWGLFVRANIWLPAGITLLGIALLYITQAILAFISEREQRMVVKRIFSRYVPEEVVNELAAHPERVTLGGEHREVTLMFTDLAGFTTLVEELEPRRAADMLNRYMTEMNRVIFRYNGTIVQFIGDAIMAFWNAPLADPDHALHAVQAACAMQSAMEGLNAQLVADGLPPLGMRIGVHTGTVLVGNMGSAIGRLYYTALGDAVNLASRLEGANKAYGTNILVSAASAEKLGGRIPMRRVDLVRVKGKHKAVEVLTPCADKRLAEASDAAILAFRSTQWDAAEAMWQDVLSLAPEDVLAALYLQRIDAFRNTPPVENWDGSMALDSK